MANVCDCLGCDAMYSDRRGDLFVVRVQAYCAPLVMEAAVPPKPARRHVPEDRNLCRHCNKNVSSRLQWILQKFGARLWIGCTGSRVASVA
jgi:hypothetical protein